VKKPAGCLDKQQICSLVRPDEIHSEVLKKMKKKLAEAVSELIMEGSSMLKKNNGAYLFSMS